MTMDRESAYRILIHRSFLSGAEWMGMRVLSGILATTIGGMDLEATQPTPEEIQDAADKLADKLLTEITS
jgi:hypothetical protein